MRKSDALEKVLRPYPEIMDVDSNQSYIDVELEFKALFRQRKKGELTSYFESLSLKSMPCMKGMFSVGLINAFYANLPTEGSAAPTNINSHYFNFYIYEGTTPGKPKKILIVDSTTGASWRLDDFLNSQQINLYDENRFFTWSYTQPVRQPMPVKFEEKINSPKPQITNNKTNTDGLFMPRKQKASLVDASKPAPLKSQKTIEKRSPNPLNNSNETLRSQAQFQQSQGSPQSVLIAPTRLSSPSTQFQNVFLESIKPIEPFPPIETTQNSPQNKNETPNQHHSSIVEYDNYLDDRAMEELYNKAIHGNDSVSRKEFLDRLYSQQLSSKLYPFVDPNKLYNLETVEWSECRIDDLVYMRKLFGFDKLPAAYFARVRALEQTGNKYVACILGTMYAQGRGVAQDLEKAFDLYQLAANQGFAPAQHNLGLMYEQGRGVAQDLKKAFELYQLAANQGFAPAQYNLGFMYAQGRGVAQDLEKAVDLLQLAANQGHAGAQYNFGGMYAHGRGVAQDLKKAFDLFQLAANQGHAAAQNNLGVMYAHGRGVAQDLKKAFDLFQLAANQGFARAQYNLGTMYEQGRGVAQDLKKAVELYQLAANQGFAAAQCNLKAIEQMRANQIQNFQLHRAGNNTSPTNQVWGQNNLGSFQQQLNPQPNIVTRSPMAQATIGNYPPMQQREQQQLPQQTPQQQLQQRLSPQPQQLHQPQLLYAKTNEVTNANASLLTGQQFFNPSLTKVSFDFTSEEKVQSSSSVNNASPLVTISQEDLNRLIRSEVQKALSESENSWIQPYNVLLRQNTEMAERLKKIDERTKFLERPEKSNHS